MVFILNLIFAVLAGSFALWVTGELGAKRPIAVILAVLIGLFVFFADVASKIL